jgi:hypothetical protein
MLHQWYAWYEADKGLLETIEDVSTFMMDEDVIQSIKEERAMLKTLQGSMASTTLIVVS